MNSFKSYLRQIIKTLKIDGVLDSTNITQMIIANYEDVEELFEHGLGSQLAAQLLTNDQQNEDCSMENFEADNNDPGDDDSDNEYDPNDDDPETDDEFPEEENIDNQTSEPDDESDDDDPEDENLDNTTFEPEDDSDGNEYEITEIFDTRFAYAILLKSEYTILLIRIQNSIFLF